jgi:hypothetical protein
MFFDNKNTEGKRFKVFLRGRNLYIPQTDNRVEFNLPF